ncbi:MAG: hypothetical protein IT359_07280 [Gemmatimonadaceae bacterium]|nr:hypothetical protein [Gemmatimonadaceae bacterium]
MQPMLRTHTGRGGFAIAAVFGVATLLTACTATPSPVHVVGTRSEVAVIAGEWEGEYHSVETGRSGNISFSLKAGTDTAFGDVVMVPRAVVPSTSDPRSAVPGIPTAPQVLPISFVRVATSTISGTLDPYKSPDCGCTLRTVFRGTISGDRIDGTFTTDHSDQSAPQQKGSWWVKRKVVAKP